MSRVNQAHIARHLGISQATVSRALHGGSVSEEIRQRVADACEELGYHLHHTAHSLASGRTGNVIYAIQAFSDLSGEMTHRHLIAAGELALAKGYKVSIDTAARVPSLAASQFMDGALIAIHSPAAFPELMQWINTTDFPVVLVDVPVDGPGIANVRVDDFQAAWDLTSYLLSLGHRHLGFFGLVEDSAICMMRYEGFSAAAEQLGGVRTQVVPIERWVGRPESVSAMHDSLSSVDMPTAFVASSDACAAGLVNVLEELGLQVPKDVSVTGFDNSRWSGGLRPPLTTMDLQSHMVGQVAMQTLLRLLQGGRRRTIRRIRAELVVRGSCAPPR